MMAPSLFQFCENWSSMLPLHPVFETNSHDINFI